MAELDGLLKQWFRLPRRDAEWCLCDRHSGWQVFKPHLWSHMESNEDTGVCHLAEEIPDPRRNVPKGILVQLTTGFTTTFFYFIALMYAISSLDNIFDGQITELPLATVYLQATGSTAGTMGLLFIFLLDIIISMPGAYIAAGRMVSLAFFS